MVVCSCREYGVQDRSGASEKVHLTTPYIMVVGAVWRVTLLVARRSLPGRLRPSRLRITAAVPQPSGRRREGDDEASGSPTYKRGLGGDLQVRGPVVPPFRQAEERKTFSDGRGRDVGGCEETLGPRQRQVMLLLGGRGDAPDPPGMAWAGTRYRPL